MNRHKACLTVIVTLLHIVVPGTSFFIPCAKSHGLLLQQQSNCPSCQCHNIIPSTFARIDASDHDSAGSEEYFDEPELVLPSEIQHADSSKDLEECSGTIIVPDLINTRQCQSRENSFDKSVLVPIFDSFLSLKKKLYAQIRDVLTAVISIITRSLTNTEVWVRDDATGQLVSSALALVSFFLAVALFAAWNIQVLGGKKWSGPTEVIVPTVRVPTSTVAKEGIKVQKAEWKRPIIQTTYKIQDDG